ncbi:MAG: prolyl oligopeptidase family serine peptidase [Acidobacteriia bacterium]|nr:prolyl oligopeptidase family serine peptidase [Terriglobia bacterium]
MQRSLLIFLAVACSLLAQTPAGGPYVPTEEERTQLVGKITELGKRISLLRGGSGDARLLADVEIYHKAAAWLMRHTEEFYNRSYLASALLVAGRGLDRARELESGNAGWSKRSGRVVRAYRSRVDGSLQPYALVIPDGLDLSRPTRMDVVLHGRGATLSEVSFIAAQENPKSAPTYLDRIELHVFGRTNNAYRWSGETDVFEAIESAQAGYKVDPDRIVLRGFSMGGAGTWHIGLHHPDRWAAMEAGAGFTETRTYAKLGQIPPYQDKTLRIYDAVEYSPNAFNLPVVGYGGELDPQLQASVNIQERLTAEGLTGLRALFLVGPQTEHRFHPDSKKESDAFLDSFLNRPRPARDQIRFVTYTTRYNRCSWLTVDGLEHHYERADVDARRGAGGVEVKTKNVSRFTLATPGAVTIDGLKMKGTGASWEKRNGQWGGLQPKPGPIKRHGLQGPIDDAFMDSFLCVRPTGTAANADAASYAARRLETFSSEYDKWLRADIRVADDRAVTAEQIRNHHLVLFGDPSSNALIGRVSTQLPIAWDQDSIRAGGKIYSSKNHLLVMIYPNPLNPDRYVVLNSGHSFGADAFRGTNALLYPRMGDWAVLNLSGGVVAAGLFDEGWKLP